MPHVTSQDGTRIEFDRAGQGPPIILIDGALAHRRHRGSPPLAAALSRSFTVISYDRRGRGDSSDTQPYSVAREIEDLERLIAEVGAPAGLYGFSSGAVLALRAAAALGSGQVTRLAVLEPPFGGDDQQARQESLAFNARMADLLKQGRRGDAVTLFLQDMLPPDLLQDIKRSPEWATMEAVAPTLAYDCELLGDGAVPVAIAATVTVPALVLDGGDSPDFKHAAADALARALPRARRRTIAGQATVIPPEVLGPVLTEFFGQRRSVRTRTADRPG